MDSVFGNWIEVGSPLDVACFWYVASCCSVVDSVESGLKSRVSFVMLEVSEVFFLPVCLLSLHGGISRPKILCDPKSYVVRQLVYTLFITNNHDSFHLW